MRPRLVDIALPPLPRDLVWVGVGGAPRIERLAAVSPVLVHFFDFAQLNSVRTLPYVRAWDDRYRDAGLTVLGVNTPRFPFTAPEGVVAAGAARLGVPYPVAVDAGFRLWRAYGCKGWPSLFLWGRGGVLRWFHFGEGEYRATEEAIQELILESDPGRRLPEPLSPLRPSDAPGALVVPPSEEVFPGGSPTEPWEAAGAATEVGLEYAAGGAYASVDGVGTIALALDAQALEPVAVDSPGLMELACHDAHEEHCLRLRPSPGVRLWSISFAAGVPATR
jgi:hypothetical protein